MDTCLDVAGRAAAGAAARALAVADRLAQASAWAWSACASRLSRRGRPSIPYRILGDPKTYVDLDEIRKPREPRPKDEGER